MGKSRMAAKLLTDTDRARQAIASNNRDQAMQCIKDALTTASQLQSVASQNGKQRLVPIYREWESAEVIAPVIAEHNRKAGNNTTNQSPAETSNQGNADRQANPPSTPETVRDVAGNYTSIGLDPKMADDHLKAAQNALQQSDMNKADSALAAVQDSVLLSSVSSDLPLVKVRQNLALASQACKNGSYQEAAAALRSASNGLSEYANSNSGSHAQKAQQLRSQIQSYASEINTGHTGAQNQIQNWWNEVTGWVHQTSAGNQRPSANTNQQQ